MRLKGCGCLLLLIVIVLPIVAWWWGPDLAAAVANRELPRAIPEAGTVIERVVVNSTTTAVIRIDAEPGLVRRIATSPALAMPEWPWTVALIRPDQGVEGRFVGIPWSARIAAEGVPTRFSGTVPAPGPTFHPIGAPLVMGDGSTLPLRLRIDALRLRSQGPYSVAIRLRGAIELGTGATTLGVPIRRLDAQFTYRWDPSTAPGISAGVTPVGVLTISTLNLGLPGFGWLKETCEQGAHAAIARAFSRIVIPAPAPPDIPVEVQVGPPLGD